MADNQVTLVGNLTDDPELRYTPNGAAVCKFRIAVNRVTRTSGQWKDGDTSYFSINAWRTLAENAAESLTRRTRDRRRPAQLPHLGEPGRRQALGDRGRGRRGRAEPQVGDGGRDPTGALGGASSSGDWGERVAAPVGGGPNRRNHRSMPGRGGPKDRGPKRRREKDDKGWQKRGKRKYCQFCKDKVDRVDYKDVVTLRKFVSERGKIRARRVTGNCVQHQRDVASAVKNAREMALLPYSSR